MDNITNAPLQDKPTYRISEVAHYYDVSLRTIYTWINKGLVDVVFTKAGQKRITRESLGEDRFKTLVKTEKSKSNKII